MKAKKIFIFLLVVVLVFALGACGDKKLPSQSSSDSVESSELLVGEWTYETGGYTYNFKADGSGTYKAGETLMEFTYEAGDGILEITYNGVGTPTKLEYSLNGETLNVKDSFGSDTIYKKK